MAEPTFLFLLSSVRGSERNPVSIWSTTPAHMLQYSNSSTPRTDCSRTRTPIVLLFRTRQIQNLWLKKRTQLTGPKTTNRKIPLKRRIRKHLPKTIAQYQKLQLFKNKAAETRVKRRPCHSVKQRYLPNRIIMCQKKTCKF